MSFGQNTAQTIKNAILTAFCENDLEISFRQIQTGSLEQNTSMEFLDVDHVIDSTAVGGFYTKEFIKPTALNRTFLHGKSHHPISVFKSIVFGEAMRMRRLNESNEHFQDSLERLRSKCLKSNFNNEVVNNIIEKAKLWTHRLSPKSDNNEKILLNELYGRLPSKTFFTSLQKKKISILILLSFINDHLTSAISSPTTRKFP